MKSEDYYNRDKSYSYKVVFWSMIGIMLVILIMKLFSI